MPGKSFLTVAIGLCVLIANVNAETADNVVSEAIEHAQGEAQGPVHEYVVQQAADQVPADIVPADAQTQRQVVESVNDAVDQGMPHMAVVTGAKADIIANAVEDGTAGAVIHIVKMGDPAPPPASAPAPKPVVSAPKEVVEVKKQLPCTVDIKKCFAPTQHIAKHVWQPPVHHFRARYHSMCGEEVRVKSAKHELKIKKEQDHKELCSKNEKNHKAMEKKVKLAVKKEAYEKAVVEGKEKYYEKKLKRAEEINTKTAHKTKEFAAKLSERANKREDELYKKECHSKENSFKAVREGKQKLRIEYVHSVPNPTPAPAPKPVPKPVPAPTPKAPVVIVPTPVVKDKTVVYVPVPSPPVVASKKKKKLATSLNEVLIKNGERVQKSQMKAHELVEKSKNAGQEAITKESFEKSAEKKGKTKGVSEMETKEHCIKEKETKEDGKKEEIKQKLAIEKVKKEAAVKEADYKKSIRQPPAPKEGSDPATCLEKFIKKCKNREQYYHEFHYKTEKKMKEVKVKNKQALIDEHCKVTKGVCQEVFDLSNVREQKLVALVNTHTSQLEASIAKAEQVSADEAKRVKFDTCARAAKDMKYFLNRVLGMGGAPSIFSRALPTLSTPPAKLV